MREVMVKLRAMRLTKAAELVEANADVLRVSEQSLAPGEDQQSTRAIIREIRRRTRVVGAFPDGHSALMLVAARLRHIASTKWGKRRYLAMETLLNPLP